MGTRKLSATKRFRLVSIDKTAELSVKEAEKELKEEILTGEIATAEVEKKPAEEKEVAEEVKEEKEAE